MSKNREEVIMAEAGARELRESFNNIRRAAFKVTRDEAAAEDVIQEMFLRLLQKDRPKFEQWLLSVVKNIAREHLKKIYQARAERGLEELNLADSDGSEQDALKEGERSDTNIVSMLRQIEMEPDALSQLKVARRIFEEAAAYVTEDLKLAEQVRVQIEEVDEIIERMGQDREEINRLKEETRSNISELQRMIAA